MDPLGGIMIGLAGKLGSEDEKTIVSYLEKLEWMSWWLDVKFQLMDINDKIQSSTDENVRSAQTSSKGAVDVVTSNNAWLNVKKASINNWLQTAYGENGAETMSATAILLMVPVLVAFMFGH